MYAMVKKEIYVYLNVPWSKISVQFEAAKIELLTIALFDVLFVFLEFKFDYITECIDFECASNDLLHSLE